MSTNFQSKVERFTNKGLVLKKEPSNLADGEFLELSNMISVQEGALTVRTGQQRLTGGVTPSGTPPWSLIHSITKLNNIAANARYVGNLIGIFRSTSSLPTSGASMSFTQVAYNTADSHITDYTQLRWASVRWNAGTVGTPYEFFATPGKMLKDTGSLSSGDQFNRPPNQSGPWNYGPGSDGTLLQQWGILPPWQPAIAYQDAIIIKPSADIIGGSGRINTTVSGSVVWNTASGAGPGYVTITPASMTTGSPPATIDVGMLLTISGIVMSVAETTPTTFSGYYSGTSPSGAITCGQVSTTIGGGQLANINASPAIDASFDGTAADSYVTDDLVHLAVSMTNPADFVSITFLVYVGGTNSDGSGSDYYQQSIQASAFQSATSGASPISSVINTAYINQQLGILGELQNASLTDLPTISQLLPTSAISPTSMAWTEFDFPKSGFTAVGNAGQGAKSWKNVTGFGLVYVATAGATTSDSIAISSIYIYGGYGPNNNNTFANTTQLLPYSYIYTYRNPVTGAESNPSIPMISTSGINATRQRIAVACAPTGDPQVTGVNSISVYRTGGNFADGFYRFVGYVQNTGFTGSGSTATPNTSAVFYDTVSDISIASAPVALFDNDAPVTSTLPQPYTGLILSITGTSPGLITANIVVPVGIQLRIGSQLHISAGPNNTISNNETVIIAKLTTGSITFYAQYQHFANDALQVNAVCAQPCTLACTAFGSVFLAGDQNNPAGLYKSKTGLPESFPIEEQQTGLIDQINVGSPSDPIMALTELNGQLVCMNLSHIFIVNVFGGQMQAPVATPANRGLIANYAWCKADNDIWYLAYDGIYTWSGGVSTKRSEAIDPLFKGYTFGGPTGSAYPPIDLTQASKITFAYYKNEIMVVYIDTSGIYHRLRYNTIWNRWWIETLNDTLNTQSPGNLAITAQFVEPDTGFLLTSKTMEYLSQFWAFLYLDDSGTSDGWVNSPTDGAAIVYAATQSYYHLGYPSIQKVFSDIDLEFNNDNSAFTFSTYYDFMTALNEAFTVTAGSSQGRRRQVIPIQSGFGNEAYALAPRFNGSTTVPLSLYSMTFNFFPLEQQQRGRATDWDDLGHPYDKRLYELVVTHEIPTGSVTLNLDVEIGVNGVQTVTTSYQTFTLLPATSSGGPSRMTSNFPITDGTVVKRVRLRATNTASNAPFQLWMDYKFKQENYPPDIVPFTEYSDYQWQYDKAFHVLWLNVDTNNQPVPVTIQADGNTSVQTVTVTGTFNNRTVPFPVNVDIIGKLVRLFVGTIPAGGKFQLFDHHFEFEKYPPDTVYWTEYNDFKYPYLKYAQQLVLDVNTNGYAVPVQLVGDGVVLQTITVTSTIQTRDQRFTLGPQLTANKFRLVVPSGSFPAGARFQLWMWDLIHERADMGPVTHSYDWDYMNWPYDKELQEITFQYDNNNAGPVTMLMDTETGIQGGTINTAAFSFVLNQATRAIQTFPFPNATFVKQVRVYPQSDFVTWRNWKHTIAAENQPPDITLFTDWSDLGWPCDKIARNLILNIDTGSVACSIELLADGNVMQTFSVTTNTNARYTVLPTNSNLIGRLWQLQLTPGGGGKSQIYSAALDFVKEPCAVNYMDTYEQDFGYTGWKFLKQCWVHYTSTASITLSIYREGDVLFYQIVLPAQATRDIVRFYLPALSNLGVLNKSRTYRMVMSSSGFFKLYSDSRIDYGMFGKDQMDAFILTTANPEAQLPVATPQVGAWQLASGAPLPSTTGTAGV